MPYRKTIMPGKARYLGTNRHQIDRNPLNPNSVEAFIEFNTPVVAANFKVAVLETYTPAQPRIPITKLPYYFKTINWRVTFQIKDNTPIGNYLYGVIYKVIFHVNDFPGLNNEQIVCYDGRGPQRPNPPVLFGNYLFPVTHYLIPNTNDFYIELDIGDPSVGITKPG